MISHLYRCISVHIPKAAGNSVNRAFSVDWQDHKDLARYRAELAPAVFNSYYKFAVVRNPWERLLSDYNYQRRKKQPPEFKLHLFDSSGAMRNFATWTQAALSNLVSYVPASWGGEVSPGMQRFSPQLDWISLEGCIAVDFVAHLERLPEDFRTIATAVGLKRPKLQHRNSRFHFHYSRYYDNATRDLVGQYYARDIAAFNYDFEDRRLLYC